VIPVDKYPQAVKFHITRARGHDAAWWIDGATHHIEISERRTGHLNTLLSSMAHEMIHTALGQADSAYNEVTNKLSHDENFKQMARAIEHEMGWKKGSM